VATLDQIKDFLSKPGKVAIVGASTQKSKAGYFVPKYLQELGFQIIPINPNTDSFLGENTLSTIDDLKEPVKGVIIYRRQEKAGKFALKAIEMDIPLIWLPDNITSQSAKDIAEEKGLTFVQDRCPLRDGRRLLN
jgi:predicted CoA-binding protein